LEYEKIKIEFLANYIVRCSDDKMKRYKLCKTSPLAAN